jgi:hypothetical protein
MSEFDNFKSCCLTEGHLQLEALDVAFFTPLKDVLDWWDKQGTQMHLFFSSLVGAAAFSAANKGAVAKLLELLGLVSTTLVVAFVDAFLAIVAGISLAAAMQVFSVCLVRIAGG